MFRLEERSAGGGHVSSVSPQDETEVKHLRFPELRSQNELDLTHKLNLAITDFDCGAMSKSRRLGAVLFAGPRMVTGVFGMLIAAFSFVLPSVKTL